MAHRNIMHVVPGTNNCETHLCGHCAKITQPEPPPSAFAVFLNSSSHLFVTSKPLFDDIECLSSKLGIASEIGEVQFMKNDRPTADQLSSFQIPIHYMPQALFLSASQQKSLLDGIQRRYSSAVVVLPVRTNQLLK